MKEAIKTIIECFQKEDVPIFSADKFPMNISPTILFPFLFCRAKTRK